MLSHIVTDKVWNPTIQYIVLNIMNDICMYIDIENDIVPMKQIINNMYQKNKIILHNKL